MIQLVKDNVTESHWPTDYKIREEIPRTRNNKNNITALKIEDTVALYPGVIYADIFAINDSEFDYLLDVKLDSTKIDSSEQEIISELNEHINNISRIVKFNVGKIKYNIEKININYVDSDREIKKNQTYVKHI